MAMTVGLIIGFANRYQSQADNSIPMQVFVIICVAATLVTITSTEISKGISVSWMSDPGRLSAQVISALGFLGTGIIWMSEKERKPKGVPVAASLWVTAIIGMLIGVGLQSATVLGTLFIVIIYWAYNLIVAGKDK